MASISRINVQASAGIDVAVTMNFSGRRLKIIGGRMRIRRLTVDERLQETVEHVSNASCIRREPVRKTSRRQITAVEMPVE